MGGLAPEGALCTLPVVEELPLTKPFFQVRVCQVGRGVELYPVGLL